MIGLKFCVFWFSLISDLTSFDDTKVAVMIIELSVCIMLLSVFGTSEEFRDINSKTHVDSYNNKHEFRFRFYKEFIE